MKTTLGSLVDKKKFLDASRMVLFGGGLDNDTGGYMAKTKPCQM